MIPDHIAKAEADWLREFVMGPVDIHPADVRRLLDIANKLDPVKPHQNPETICYALTEAIYLDAGNEPDTREADPDNPDSQWSILADYVYTILSRLNIAPQANRAGWSL